MNVSQEKLINSANAWDDILVYKMLYELEIPGGEPLSIILLSDEIDLKSSSHIKLLKYISHCGYQVCAPALIGVKTNFITEKSISNLDRISIDNIKKDKGLFEAINASKEKTSHFIATVISKFYISSLLSYSSEEQFLDFNYQKYKNILVEGNFGLAAIIKNCFEKTGWFLDILGYIPNQEDTLYGYVPGIDCNQVFSKHFFDTESIGYDQNTEFFVSEYKEKEFSKIGIISLCNIVKDNKIVLRNIFSFKNFCYEKIEEDNIELNIQYILCACRFMHYLKVIGREKTGQFSQAQDFESYLKKWILEYIASNPNLDKSLKTRYPLMDAKIKVKLDPFVEKNIYVMFI